MEIALVPRTGARVEGCAMYMNIEARMVRLTAGFDVRCSH
jgi:hypothetical protein